ncbi:MULTISPECIES: hypothetical protein [Pseudomonadota]|jgi:hypothetical protein|uniref:hypothetical protein n=1 Tax=Pseudomonadota TaxID=1224 RepID=UPI0013FD5FD2|nr:MULTISPECIES: hypothetical protein [Pseudomonadota]MDD4887132.1 hypothetical protein [Thiomonas sp.]EKW5284279.1 hypothetical protein [Pseudomonas aeruginosa]EKW5491415.1 hypothetical protein [Pseudomonas aeruginosa]MBG4376962.1 hypothetical protein [Pseudomonas aeruginosa]MCT5067069.1 hypothetical protein [Pseudomonas aeruginosa]
MSIYDTDSIPFYGWGRPKIERPIDTPQGQADLKLIVNVCYEAILKCDDPAVRYQAARLLQAIGPMKGTLQ